MASNQILTIDGKVVTNGSGGIVFLPPSDITPPTVVLENTPANRVSTASVNITIAAGDAVAYKYRLDGGSYGAEVSVDTPVQLSGLSEAEHTLYVIGKDLAGNWQVEPTTCTWIVDLTPPVATLSNTPANPTSATTTDITVGGDDVVAYKYSLNDSAYSDPIPVSTPIQLSNLVARTYDLKVIARDTAGNWKPTANATSYTWNVVNSSLTSLVHYFDPSYSASFNTATPTYIYSLIGTVYRVSYSRYMTYYPQNGSEPPYLYSDGNNRYYYKPVAGTKYFNNFTTTVWCKPTATHTVISQSTSGTAGTSGQRLILAPQHGSNDTGSGYAGSGLSVGTNGVNVIEHSVNYAPGTLVWSGTVSSSMFSEITVVYNNRTPSLYINGSFVKTGLQSPMNVYDDMMIGTNYFGCFVGSFGMACQYSKALNASEVLSNYNANKTRFGL